MTEQRQPAARIAAIQSAVFLTIMHSLIPIAAWVFAAYVLPTVVAALAQAGQESWSARFFTDVSALATQRPMFWLLVVLVALVFDGVIVFLLRLRSALATLVWSGAILLIEGAALLGLGILLARAVVGSAADLGGM